MNSKTNLDSKILFLSTELNKLEKFNIDGKEFAQSDLYQFINSSISNGNTFIIMERELYSHPIEGTTYALGIKLHPDYKIDEESAFEWQKIKNELTPKDYDSIDFCDFYLPLNIRTADYFMTISKDVISIDELSKDIITCMQIANKCYKFYAEYEPVMNESNEFSGILKRTVVMECNNLFELKVQSKRIRRNNTAEKFLQYEEAIAACIKLLNLEISE